MTIPEITKLHTQSYKAFEKYFDWVKTAKPTEFLEYNEENAEKAQKTKPELLATYHGTCDGDQITVGFHDFGPEPRCCWDTYGWYICKEPRPVDSYVNVSDYAPCVTCNPNGEDEVETEEPCSECEGDGWVTYYFDDHIDPLELTK